ncbi:hypothetical protein DN402_11315 [Streptomyces sp. SW4]|nr:hypothetical protein DN402_11315 [Streptomyces sp. SW4]
MRSAWLEAHVVGPAPEVGLAGEPVAHRYRLVPVQAELRHVQRDRGLLGVVGSRLATTTTLFDPFRFE